MTTSNFESLSPFGTEWILPETLGRDEFEYSFQHMSFGYNALCGLYTVLCTLYIAGVKSLEFLNRVLAGRESRVDRKRTPG